ncbi:hypothetical protein ACRAWD_03035 [Caulobacter segnis]
MRSVTWAGEDYLILVVSQTEEVRGLMGPAREYYIASAFNWKTKKLVALLRNQEEAMNVIVGPPMVRTIDGEPVVFLEGVHFVDNRGVNTLYRVNLRGNTTRMLDYGARVDTDDWLVDPNGEPTAQSLYDGKRGRWSLRMKLDGAWRTVDEADTPMGSYGVAGFGRDGKSVLVSRTDDKGNDFLREYSGGRPVRRPAQRPQRPDPRSRDPGPAGRLHAEGRRGDLHLLRRGRPEDLERGRQGLPGRPGLAGVMVQGPQAGRGAGRLGRNGSGLRPGRPQHQASQLAGRGLSRRHRRSKVSPVRSIRYTRPPTAWRSAAT